MKARTKAAATVTPEPPAHGGMCRMTKSPDPMAVAFRKAQTLAAQSPAARLEVAPLEFLNEEFGDAAEAVGTIREALVHAYIARGARVTNDPHGELFAREFAGDEDQDRWDAFRSVVDNHQEAAYLYGLALGLQLAKGGAR